MSRKFTLDEKTLNDMLSAERYNSFDKIDEMLERRRQYEKFTELRIQNISSSVNNTILVIFGQFNL